MHESKPRKELVVKNHQKRKIVRSQTQALSLIASTLNQLVKLNAKRQKEQMNFEKDRDKAFLKSKKQKAEKNYQLEIEMVKIFAGTLGSTRLVPPNMPSFYSQQPYQIPGVTQSFQQLFSSHHLAVYQLFMIMFEQRSTKGYRLCTIIIINNGKQCTLW